ncbi:MAG: hypothetical protein LH606_09845 [Cytophagaceae bacterium]|nr:hypothetical protein [Cytophagaceae bacterium]
MKQPLPRRFSHTDPTRQSGWSVWPVFGWVPLAVCGLLFALTARAQVPTAPAKARRIDSIRTIPPPEIVTPKLPVARDSSRIRDSLFYTNLKRRMEKRGLTRDLYNFLFRDVYNSRANQEVSKIDENPFAEFEGRVIRSIKVRRLAVFGPSVYDTLRKSDNWFERVGNRLHADTREGVIKRSFLLFREGESIDPEKLRNNERLLRTANIFHDARIVVIPERLDPRVVDVLILTQDVWSLIPDGGVGGLTNFQLNLEQRNFRGLAHSFTNGIRFDGNAPYQRFEFLSRYRIPYIGKTFITGEAGVLWLRDQKIASIDLYRPFLTPESKWAGAFRLSYNALRNRVFLRTGSDSTLVFPLNFSQADLWVGRAFKLNFINNAELQRRARLILAARISDYNYTQRPEVTPDTNQLYQNSRSVLFSLGFTNRDYRRDLLIYGFGRTEDVPIGYLAQLVSGYESTEFGRRTYMALKLARGAYLNKNRGYLYTLANFGGYFRPGKVEQGILSLESNYFSPLLGWGKSNFRHFINVRYTVGINRFNNEYISISNQNGIIGASSDLLRGTKRFTFGVESVFFSPFNVIGFRVAMFGFSTFGLVSSTNKTLFNGPLYQGYGLGFRLRNENLTFNTVQFRLGWYPNLPGNRPPFRLEFSGETPLRFNDFNFDRPEYRSDGFENNKL